MGAVMPTSIDDPRSAGARSIRGGTCRSLDRERRQRGTGVDRGAR
jgi:hypothetical protein